MERETTETEAVSAGGHKRFIRHDDAHRANNVHRPNTRVRDQRFLGRIHGLLTIAISRSPVKNYVAGIFGSIRLHRTVGNIKGR